MLTRIVTVKRPVIIAAIASAVVTIFAAILSNADGIVGLFRDQSKPEMTLVRLVYFPDQKSNAFKLRDALTQKKFNVTLSESDKGIEHVKYYSPYMTYRSTNKEEARLIIKLCESQISRKLEPHSGDDITEGIMFVVLTSQEGRLEAKKEAEQDSGGNGG